MSGRIRVGGSGVNSQGEEIQKGNLAFKEKNVNYLEELSRNAVEEYNNYEILYFQIDWDNSNVNFYGEVKDIKFKNEKGIRLKCKINVSENPLEKDKQIFNKTNNAVVSVYDQLLNELDINLNRGDYFLFGNRFYYIYDYTIKDISGVGMANGVKLRTDIFAYEEGDERLNNNIFNDLIKKIQLNDKSY